MFNPCSIQKAAAKALAAFQGLHGDVEADAAEALSVTGRAEFAHQTVGQDDALARDSAKQNPGTPEARAAKKLTPLGFVEGFATANTHPSTILGEDFIRPLLDVLQEHKDGEGNWADFKANVQPVIEQLKAKAQLRFDGDNGKQSFANRYLDWWEKGGNLYDHPDTKDQINQQVTNTVLYPVRTAAGNLVSFNPFIATAHAAQFVPKSLGLYGVPATLKGIADYIGNFTKHGLNPIPELADAGVTHQAKGLEQLNPVGHADNLMKGLAYYTGKAAGIDPLKAVQDIAYRDRLGDEPMIQWNPQNAQSVYLMRFMLGFAKQYAGWYKNIIQGALKGDLKMASQGAASLAAFTVAQSLFTGTKSAIPAPIWFLLPVEVKQQIQDLDDSQPFLNVLKHTTGIDVSGHFQPVGGLALGIGYDVWNTDVKGAASHTKKALEALENEDYAHAGVETVKGALSAGNAFVPGVNVSMNKLASILGDYVTGDLQGEEVLPTAAQKFHFLPTGSD